MSSSSFIPVIKTFKDMLLQISTDLIKNEWTEYVSYLYSIVFNKQSLTGNTNQTTTYSVIIVKEFNKILDKILKRIFDGEYDNMFENLLQKIHDIKSYENVKIYKSPENSPQILFVRKCKNNNIEETATFMKYNMVIDKKPLHIFGNNRFGVDKHRNKLQKIVEEENISDVTNQSSNTSNCSEILFNRIDDTYKYVSIRQKKIIKKSSFKRKEDINESIKDFKEYRSCENSKDMESNSENIWSILYQEKNEEIKIKKIEMRKRKNVKKCETRYIERKIKRDTNRAKAHFLKTIKIDTRWEFAMMITTANFENLNIIRAKIKALFL